MCREENMFEERGRENKRNIVQSYINISGVIWYDIYIGS